jgi:hypothetical protein
MWNLKSITSVGDDFEVDNVVIGGIGSVEIENGAATITMAGVELQAQYSGAVSGAQASTVDGRLHGEMHPDSTVRSLNWTADSAASPFRITADGRQLTDDELGGLSLPSSMRVAMTDNTMEWTYTEGDPWGVTTTWTWVR